MSREEIRIKAAQALALAEDEVFKAFVAEVRDAQIAAFRNSRADQTEVREEAHAILRALDAIEHRLKSAMIDEVIEAKKEQHRGND